MESYNKRADSFISNTSQQPSLRNLPPQKPPRQYRYSSILEMSSHLHMHSASTSTLPIRVVQPPSLYPSSYSTTMLPSNSNSNTSTQYNSRNSTNQNLRNTPILRSSQPLSNIMHNNFNKEITQQDLLNNLETQKQKIITNETEIEQRRALLNAYNRTMNSSKHITSQTPIERSRHILSQRTKLQSEIAEGERDLHRMISAHKSLLAAEEFNNVQRQKLSELKEEAEVCGQNLREAVGKADYLKQRLEQLLQKRASAASAAIAQQRKINGVTSDNSNSYLQQPIKPVISRANNFISNNKPLFKSNGTQRPQASVEPFSIKNRIKSNISTLPLYEVSSNLNNKDCIDSPSKFKENQKTNGKCSGYESIASDASSSSGIEEQNKLAATYKTDQLVVRSDTLKAAKRRSLVQSDNNGESESDNIWRLLVEEQKKGKTHITFSELFSNRDKNKNMQDTSRSPSEESNISNDKVQMTEEQILKAESSDEAFVEEFNSIDKDASDDESNQAKKLHAHGITIAPSESSSCASDDSLAHLKSVDIYDSVSEQSISPPIHEGEEELEENHPLKEVKSILRSTSSSSRGRIRFDPLVLFLDAALEGQIETVMENASKVPDVSQPNEEGITALHNAICAGYLEVVEYLISMKANVNAQDSDGWTPLHCAASCNSLSISRILIENGACLYSQTISDLETPEHKLENEEEFYNECLLFFKIVGKSMGLINDSNVYACYDYEANNDDEMSFKKDDILKVISKPEDEEYYWLCENRENGEKGLIPRNFVSLYPSVKLREKIDYKPFNIPTSLEMCEKIQEKNHNIYQRPKISPPLPPK
uniref:SH3 domain-containing protein n=1 Tax=Parastrongyloides trichosuri TaxID=131310 RepID=A0A0N4ZTL6_PARTI